MAFKKYYCDMYNANIWFLYNCDHIECKKILEKKLKATVDDWAHEDSEGFTEVYSDPNVFVVWIKEKKDIYTLLHECVHLAIEILNDRGIKFSEKENGEVLAYYIEKLFKTLIGKNKV